MMETQLKVLKNFSKHVTCFGLPPLGFERDITKHWFNQSWDIIEAHSDQTFLYDFEKEFPEYDKQQTPPIIENSGGKFKGRLVDHIIHASSL